MICRKKIFFSLFLIFSSVCFFGQIHRKFPIVNFTPKEYGKDRNVQNWALTQSNEGLIYSGSNNGILEYDGYKWKFIPAVYGKYVYSLATDSNNVVYVGTEGNFGFLQKDKKGKFNYVSLSDSLLKEEDKFFSKIWRIFAGSDRIYFQANEAVFVYDYKNLKTLYPVTGTSFHLASFANNTLYVRERQKGLMKVVKDKLEYIPNSELFAEYGVFAMLPWKSKNEVLIITKEKGLHTYNTLNNQFNEFITPENSVWYNAGVIGGTKLRNGNYAINTESFGTIIMNDEGKIIHYINSAIDLQDNNVLAQLEDKSGNLWMGLNNGLSKVELCSALQMFNNMQGNINSVRNFKGRTFVAGSVGLWSKDSLSADFTIETGFPYNSIVWQLTEHEDKLYAASNVGVFAYDGSKFSKVLNGNFRRILFSKSNRILAGGPDELLMLNSSFSEVHNFKDELFGEILGMEDDPASSETAGVYWVSTNTALYRIIDPKNEAYKIKAYDVSYGLTDDWKYPFLFNNRIVVGNNFGLYQLSSTGKDDGLFETIPFFGEETAGRSFSFLSDNTDKTIEIIENKPHVFYKNNNKKITAPFLPIDMGKENSLYSNENKLYICLDEGLAIYDESDKRNYTQNFEIVLRKIVTKKDSVLFEGASVGTFQIDTALSFDYNEIGIEFSNNFLCNENKSLYRYRISGADTAYSEWQSEHKIKINNLHEGKYSLTIQSVNIYGTQGNELVITFKVLAPWYRTTMAYIFYIIAFILFVFAAIKIASYRLQQQNKQLDNLVKIRTQEIADKNEALKEQNEQILHQKQEITDSINYAKRIQNAILPPIEEIKRSWKDTFVFFQPKDIVSGDFYWFHKINDHEFLIACADCTGHGVPGGFMSMVCSDKLNEAVTEAHQPSAILERVNVRIKQSLRQDGSQSATKDGMEIALLKVNTESKIVQYAGANRFLWIIRAGNEEIEEIKSTKAGIGGHTPDEQLFKEHTINANSGDQFYVSTDGFGDQFGGPSGKKLMTKNFKDYLLKIKNESMESQSSLLENHINSWKQNYEQVDDILVIGIKM